MAMTDEGDGVSAVWLCCFLRDAPPGTVVRGIGDEFDGLVVEMPAESPAHNGNMVELAYIHNSRRVEITEAGKRWLTADQAWDI